MRIAIVNDVPMATEALRRVLTSKPDYQIAWVAKDGEEAVRLCSADIPDLILMDLMMPRMDGAEACKIIMRQSPCAILVVTSTVGGHSSKVFEAMGWGALDAVNTPVLTGATDERPGSELLGKIATIAKLIGKTKHNTPSAPKNHHPQKEKDPGFPLIAIGASTGGPTALCNVLQALPRNLEAAIAIVQHVDEVFAPGLADWLARESSREVRVIHENDRPDASIVHLASTNDHLLLTPELTYTYAREPEKSFYRPSVDVFFQTIVRHWPGAAIGVLLTGMGDDGAKGLLAMKRAGWHTIAQDQATCIAYGMPKAAARLNAAVRILPLEEIGAAIARALPAVSYLRQRSYP